MSESCLCKKKIKSIEHREQQEKHKKEMAIPIKSGDAIFDRVNFS